MPMLSSIGKARHIKPELRVSDLVIWIPFLSVTKCYSSCQLETEMAGAEAYV